MLLLDPGSPVHPKESMVSVTASGLQFTTNHYANAPQAHPRAGVMLVHTSVPPRLDSGTMRLPSKLDQEEIRNYESETANQKLAENQKLRLRNCPDSETPNQKLRIRNRRASETTHQKPARISRKLRESETARLKPAHHKPVRTAHDKATAKSETAKQKSAGVDRVQVASE